jgi:hypothetical protein
MQQVVPMAAPVPPAASALESSASRSSTSLRPAQSSSADFAFSAGLEQPGSWLSANKYVIGVFAAAAIVVMIVLLLR